MIDWVSWLETAGLPHPIAWVVWFYTGDYVLASRMAAVWNVVVMAALCVLMWRAVGRRVR